jgi:hypothetical protein
MNRDFHNGDEYPIPSSTIDDLAKSHTAILAV